MNFRPLFSRSMELISVNSKLMIQEITDSDYPMLVEWWAAHQWPAIPKEALPPLGYISWKGEKPILAGYVYFTLGSTMCWLEWIVGNPDSTPEERGEALKEIVEKTDQVARENGYSMIFTATKHKKLIERFKSNGFNVTEEEMTHLLKVLPP